MEVLPNTDPNAEEIPFAPYVEAMDPTAGIECPGDDDFDDDFDREGAPVVLGRFAGLPDRERRERLARGEIAFRRYVVPEASERAFAEIVAATGHAVLSTIFSQSLSSRVAAALRQVRDDY